MFIWRRELQRILPRGEIEALDHNTIPRVQLPARESVFATRAARLRQLAADSPVADYLLLMARLVDAQHRALKGCAAPPASQAVSYTHLTLPTICSV